MGCPNNTLCTQQQLTKPNSALHLAPPTLGTSLHCIHLHSTLTTLGTSLTLAPTITGLHGTYGADEICSAVDTVECTALLFMQDLSFERRRQAAKRWCVQDVKRRCPSVQHFVAMDCGVRCYNGGAGGTEGFVADASFLDWVRTSGAANDTAAEGRLQKLLDDPFEV
jgi:hypothetical protein